LSADSAQHLREERSIFTDRDGGQDGIDRPPEDQDGDDVFVGTFIFWYSLDPTDFNAHREDFL